MITLCPVCKESSLSDHELEANLHSSQCRKCKGVWIGAAQYDLWLEKHGENLPEKPEAEATVVSAEPTGAKFCPECKSILVKYKVGHQTGFSLDKCGHCGGIWLDSNEWEVLKSRNLHDDVHLMFSDAWQTAVRSHGHEAAMEQIWRNLLGDADFDEIRRIKIWLERHPKSAELNSYLRSGSHEMK